MSEPTREELMAKIAALQQQTKDLQQLVAAQSGSGGVAQGPGAAAAGERGVAVAGDFHGNVYMGKPPENEKQAVAIYRRMLEVSCRRLPLRGVDVGASDPTGGGKQLDLDQVYVSLDTTAPLNEQKPGDGGERASAGQRTSAEDRRLSALEAVTLHRRVILLGDPGSGKSTFVNHLSLCLALHGLEPEGHWCERLQCWPKDETDLLPVPVVLRDFARAIPKRFSRHPIIRG